MFSNSANPLLTMVLLYELLSLVAKKFFSLSYTCRQLMDQIKQLLMELIEQIDDENFLTTALLDRDYIGRDSLSIAVELELLDMIQIPKVEAVIKRIWNSDYDTSGSFFEMSTPFQIVNQSSAALIDIEETNRAWKERNIEGLPQYDSNFNIFQYSMYSRMKGMGLVTAIYIACTIFFFEKFFMTTINAKMSLTYLGYGN